MDALLHVNAKRNSNCKAHKLELLATGGKSIRQMSELISSIFDVEPNELRLMRIDFASDLDGVPLMHAFESVRVKFKRSTTTVGKLEYETVGKRRLEYFRYGKSPNCFRVYDKPAECMARYPGLLKHSNPDAEPPTFEDLFGFSADAIRTRIERQSGGRGIPEQLQSFGQLQNAAEFNPFANVEIIPNGFPIPDPRRFGASRSAKLIGIHGFIQTLGFQQARSLLNCDRNAGRLFDDYREYLNEVRDATSLTIDDVVASYRRSVTKQVNGTIGDRSKSIKVPTFSDVPESKHSAILHILGAQAYDCRHEDAQER